MPEEAATKLVTIIITCYNHDEYIAQAVESALNQTYKEIEVIVINNGSTDRSAEIIRRYASDDRVRIIHLKENIPVPVTLALTIAKGDYISILYSDDYYRPEKIQLQIDAFSKAPETVGLVYCHGYTLIEDGKNKLIPWVMGHKSGFLFHEHLTSLSQFIPISPLVRRECYSFIGINNIWTGSEYDWFVISAYFDCLLVDQHLVVMRQHKKNDRFNISSVFDRVVRFNNIFFSSDAVIKRACGLHHIWLSKIFLIFARDFSMLNNREKFFKAFLTALRHRLISIFSQNGIASLLYIMLPFPSYLFTIKILSTVKSYCRWFRRISY